jgi:hypothetical protein
VLTLEAWRRRLTAGIVNMLEPRLAFRCCIVRLFDESLEVLTVNVRNVSQRSDAVDGISMLGRCMLEQAALMSLTPSTAFCDCFVTKVSFLHHNSAPSFSRLLVMLPVRVFAASNLASSLYLSHLLRHGNTGRDFPSCHDSP